MIIAGSFVSGFLIEIIQIFLSSIVSIDTDIYFKKPLFKRFQGLETPGRECLNSSSSYVAWPGAGSRACRTGFLA